MRIAEKSVFRRISTKLYAQHQACDINAPAGERDQQQQNHMNIGDLKTGECLFHRYDPLLYVEF
jgi:hypothetical protein